MGIRSVTVARLVYLLLCEMAGVLIALSTKGNLDFTLSIYEGLAGGLVVGGFFILVESLMKGFTLRGFSTATFGILIGLLCAWLLTRVGLDDLVAVAYDDEAAEVVVLVSRVVIFSSLGFLGAALALRSAREDFAFIIPYVRFRSESLGGRPVLLDESSITDGRVASLVEAGFVAPNLVVPSFELSKVQALSDSPDPRKNRLGRRGLDQLDQLRAMKSCELRVHDSLAADELESEEESRVLQVARLLGARLLTNSPELTQVARLREVEVMNLSDLQKALGRPVEIGDTVSVYLAKAGKDEHQGVGYLQDGTMIVVNHAVSRIGTTVRAMIVGSLDTASGELYFAELA